MKLEYYAISAICNYDDAATYAITKMGKDDFIEHKKAYSIATGLFQLKKQVDLHVFVSQMQGAGYNENEANLIYHYCLDFDDNWQNNFEELKRISAYRKVSDHLGELTELKNTQEPVQVISSKAMKFATEWITGVEKKYYSGEEIDNLTEEFGEPIKTGYEIYDEGIYKYGGNQKGQMKGVICREKHGKTRSECWEVAQNIRMGYKVLYITLEGRKQDITGNVRQVLQHEWEKYRSNLFVVDGTRNLDELEAITVEAVLVEGVDKVVVDYMQLVEPSERVFSENEKINIATERFRNSMVKHNYHLVVLNQARKESMHASSPKDADGNHLMPSGYKYVPSAYDAYGSNALIKACSMVLVGFRPNQYPELTKVSPIGKKVVNPKHNDSSYYSFFMHIERTRYKPHNLHRWYQFTDSDEGLKLNGWI